MYYLVNLLFCYKKKRLFNIIMRLSTVFYFKLCQSFDEFTFFFNVID